MAVVGTAGMLEIEDERHAVLGVVFGAAVPLFEGAIRARAFSWVVHPANEVIVIVFFADAAEIRGKRAAHDVRAFTNGMAAEAAARFEKLLAVHGVAHRLLGTCRAGERRFA